jgi:prepilin-type N-terminal cleavage/methylation domain-containing protein
MRLVFTRDRDGATGSHGFTLIELLVVVGIIGVVAAIALPQLMSARRSGNHASAIASLRTISSAQDVFASSCGNGTYATSLTQLAAVPLDGGPPFISPDLSAAAVVTKSGYQLSVMRASDGVAPATPACNGVAAADLSSAYYATASPLVAGSSGNWYFWLGTPGTIFQDTAPIAEDRGFSESPGGRPIQ